MLLAPDEADRAVAVELADPASLSFGNHQTSRGSVFVIPRPGYVRVITSEIVPPAR